MRHFTTSLLLSMVIPIPVIGAVIVILMGYIWEYVTHGYTIPDDEDTQKDLSNDILGAAIGNIIVTIILVILYSTGA